MKIDLPPETISEIVREDLYDVLDTLERGYAELDPVALGVVLKYYTKMSEHPDIDKRVQAIVDSIYQDNQENVDE